jgi:hypothetical protein
MNRGQPITVKAEMRNLAGDCRMWVYYEAKKCAPLAACPAKLKSICRRRAIRYRLRMGSADDQILADG